MKKAKKAAHEPMQAAILPMPISIRVAYDWDDSISHKIVWHTIKIRFTKIIEGLRRKHGNRHFAYYVGRMRAAHASDLCASIVERCKVTDIVAFDISTHNANVLFELGVALGAKGASSGEVFLLARVDAPVRARRANAEAQKPNHGSVKPIPTDLAGYLQTRYWLEGTKTMPSMVLMDWSGFQAAVVSKVMEIARQRGMLNDQGGLGD